VLGEAVDVQSWKLYLANFLKASGINEG